ncbi:diguanylate cyclase [bacterium]|nr:diguanylate cyclase [bacterium]
MINDATILIVDDTKDNINILLSLLDDFDLLVALNGKKALSLIQKHDVDLILLDIMMPDMDGYEVCKKLKSQEETKDIPILFITAKTDEQSIEKAFESGGMDFVTKPFKPKELLARVKIQLELRKTLKALEFAATRDSMTGIYNRREFFIRGKQRFVNNNDNFFAVMIDIDRFKNINDSYGHAFGDTIIKSVAKTILDHITPEAIFGRIGGEEFAIISILDSIESLKGCIEGIRELIQLTPHECNGEIVRVSVSNGIAKRETGDTIDTLLNRADQALYEAKGSGRNKTCFRI